MKRVKVLENREVAPGVHHLSFEFPFSFVPGQLTTLGRQGVERTYSLASSCRETRASILFNRVEDGELTPWLSGVSPGTEITVSPPFGDFRPERFPAYWICNGTGIAPFLSGVLSGKALGSTKLFHGARQAAGFFFREVFEKHPFLGYYPCCTGETGPGIISGRLTEQLRTLDLPSDAHYYICGSSPMIIEVRDILLSKAVPFASILSEYYY